MPQEFAILLALLIISTSVYGVIKLLFDYLRDRSAVARKGNESSLTTGQLNTILRESVEEAIEPLVRRIESLESTLQAKPRLLEEGRPMIALDEEGDSESEYAAAPRRKMHSQ